MSSEKAVDAWRSERARAVLFWGAGRLTRSTAWAEAVQLPTVSVMLADLDLAEALSMFRHDGPCCFLVEPRGELEAMVLTREFVRSGTALGSVLLVCLDTNKPPDLGSYFAEVYGP